VPGGKKRRGALNSLPPRGGSEALRGWGPAKNIEAARTRHKACQVGRLHTKESEGGNASPGGKFFVRVGREIPISKRLGGTTAQ